MSDSEEHVISVPEPVGPLTSLEEAGYWEGERFIFNEPIEVATENGKVITMTELDTTGMTLQDGIERDDVVHAIINQVHAQEL